MLRNQKTDSNLGLQQKLILLLSFLLPLENLFEFFLDIDTIFKPYRIVEILLILAYFMKAKYKSGINVWYYTLPLIVILFGGVSATIINITGVEINYYLVFNFLLLFGLNFFLFVIVLEERFNQKFTNLIFISFLAGLFLNIVPFLAGKVPEDNRYSGFFDNSNSFGLYLVIGSIMVFYLKKNGKINMLVSGCYLLFIFYFINITYSRTSLVLFFIVLALLFAFRSKYSILVLFICAIFLWVKNFEFIRGLNALNRHELKEQQGQENERIIFAKAGVDAFVETNFVGVGIGQFQQIENFYKYVSAHSGEIAQSRKSKGSGLGTHNSFIQMMSEFGIIGFLGFVVFMLRILIFLKQNRSFYSFFSSYEFSFFLVLLLYSTSHVVFFSPLFWFIIALSVQMKFNFNNVHFHSYRKIWRNKPPYHAS